MKVKQVIFLVIGAGLVAAALLLPVVPWLVGLFEGAGDLGIRGPVALGGLYIVSCVFLIPASIPTLAAGSGTSVARRNLRSGLGSDGK